MNPSTSLGTRSNVGMAKPSPPVRQAGNIGSLLMIRGVCRRKVPSGGAQVKSKCRCRVMSDVPFHGAERPPCVRDCDMMTQSSLCTDTWFRGVEGGRVSHLRTEDDRGRRIKRATATRAGGRLYNLL